MQLDLLAIGLTTIDITVHPVLSLPEGEAGQIVEKIALSPAGTAGGTALVAQTLGLRAGIASAVGNDPQSLPEPTIRTKAQGVSWRAVPAVA